MLFFDEDSQQPNIKSAMRTARQMRKQLRELEAAGAFTGTSAPSRSRRYSGRSRADTGADG